jgi:hypothetical protein
VRYIVDNTLKTMVIDVNLVPIQYDYANLEWFYGKFANFVLALEISQNFYNFSKS